MNNTRPAPLTPLEVAAGYPIGSDPASIGLVAGRPRFPPRAALERAIRPALARTPCVVSFSGGRDSSAMLAVTTALARREGFAEPVAVTLRFRNAPGADESEWQEQVIRHLGVHDWHKIEVGGELDMLGAEATGPLRRHGLLWPPNLYVHAPVLAAARGGSLIDGDGGDDLFGTWSFVRVRNVLAGRTGPRPSDLIRLGLMSAPRPVRRWRYRRRHEPLPWLTARGEDLLRRAQANEYAEEPGSWPAWLAWWRGRRHVAVGVADFDRLCSDWQVAAHHPLLDPGFLAAMGADGGPAGYGDRTACMVRLFADVLPNAVLHRRTKAFFDEALLGSTLVSFSARWQGEGVDPTLVDLDRLRAVWSGADMHFGTLTMLHAAWLALETADGTAGHPAMPPSRSATSGSESSCRGRRNR